MADLLGYKCPSCGAKIEFDSTSQQMKCPYCDSEFDVASLQAYDEVLNQQAAGEGEMNWDNDAGADWEPGEAEGMRVYKCQSCGGEVIADGSTAASQCPYCDAPVIMMGQLAGDLKPDFVIPFQLDKEAAKKSLMKHMEGKPLLPKVFKSQNHIDEIKGVYVPVWLYEADVDAQIQFKSTKVRRWSDSNYSYVETSYYNCYRAGQVGFEHVPVDGSEKMDDTLMESLEPFDFSKAVNFQTAYLSGYLADKYDIDAEASSVRATDRIRQGTRDSFRDTVKGYNTVEIENENINLQKGETHYALYPVWLLNTSWNDKKFVFAMNGQSGKFVGDLPADKMKAVLFFLIGAVVGGLIGWFINSENLLVPIIAALLAGGIVLGILWSQLKSVHKEDSARNYVKQDSFHLAQQNDRYLYKKTERTARQKSN
ncbi:MAG: hypothetical protein IKQ39_07265 [Oscillospiraceae bacterium]|nr:hypothetical protein [Oscillospiraceae bacterium]